MSVSSEMEDIIQDFIVEASESLDSLDQKFVELEKKPQDVDLLNDIFRSVHTIKGAAGFLGFQQMVEMTHATEDVLNRLRKGEMVVTPEIMDAILQAVDMIKVLLENIRKKNNKEEDISPLVELLKGISEGNTTQKKRASTKKSKAKARGKNATKETKAEEVKEEEQRDDASPSERMKKDGEVSTVREREYSIRVDIERLDNVLNFVGELVLARNRLLRLGSKLVERDGDDEIVSQLEEAISQLDLVTMDLQLGVMKMRMQPIARVFSKFPRMVRDLARYKKKEVELILKGEETELDKTVIEEIGDPLVHLVRNAVDHGIEPPEERKRKGKPRYGTIVISAYQEGRNIIVCVEDDGKGINPEDIKRSAVDKGLISQEEAERLSNKDAVNLIFTPGFSTAREVSDISGRGVGMDVVKTNISRINGTISVESEPGKGTRMIFRLPLTLAIIQALTVEAGGEVYGIPLSNVVENIRITQDDLRTVDGREVIHIRDRVLPVVRLGRLVSVGNHIYPDDDGWRYVVIVAIGEKRFGLLVDRLHGQEEIVMKSMGEYLKGTEGIAGACITGDGNVILILDVASLVDKLRMAYL